MQPFGLLDEEEEQQQEEVKQLRRQEEEDEEMEPSSKKARANEPPRSRLSDAGEKTLSRANSAFLAGQAEEAWQLCRLVLQENGEAHEPYQTMLAIAQEREHPSAALLADLSFHCCRNNPASTVEQWSEAARLVDSAGDKARLAECLGRLLRFRPHDAGLRWRRVRLLRETGRADAAVGDLRALWRQDGKSGEAALLLSGACLERGLLDEGVRVLRSCQHSTPQHSVMLARLYLASHRFKDALDTAAELCREGESAAGARLLMGTAHARLGNWEEAAKCWREAREEEASEALLGEAAQACLEGKRSDLAEQLMSRISEDSTDKQAVFARALLLESKDEEEAALRLVEGLLDRGALVAGMQEMLLRHMLGARCREAVTLSHRLAQIKSSRQDEEEKREEEEQVVVPDAKMKKQKRSNKDEEDEDAELVARRNATGGWRHAVPERGTDEKEADECPPCRGWTPKSFCGRVAELFTRGRVGAVLRVTAPVLQADLSRKIRFRTSGSKRVREKLTEDMTYLVREVGERKYLDMAQAVLRCLAAAGNEADVSRHLDELLRMQWTNHVQRQALCCCAFALGWPFSRSDVSLALRQLRHLLQTHRDSRHLWNVFARLCSSHADVWLVFEHLITSRLKRPAPLSLHCLLAGHVASAHNKLSKALPLYQQAVAASQESDVASLLSAGVCHLDLARTAPSDRASHLERGLALVRQASEAEGGSAAWKYNLGRAYHGVGMAEEAEACYRQCIRQRENKEEEEDERMAVERDAAFNLHLLLVAAGRMEEAAQIMDKHLVV